MLTKNMSRRNFDVTAYSYPVYVSPVTGWERGNLMRTGTVEFRTSKWDLYQYDSTNPATWNNRNG